jgi:hypothetical protein
MRGQNAVVGVCEMGSVILQRIAIGTHIPRLRCAKWIKRINPDKGNIDARVESQRSLDRRSHYAKAPAQTRRRAIP